MTTITIIIIETKACKVTSTKHQGTKNKSNQKTKQTHSSSLKKELNSIQDTVYESKTKHERKSEWSTNGSWVAHNTKDSSRIAPLNCHREPLLKVVGGINLPGSTKHNKVTKF